MERERFLKIKGLLRRLGRRRTSIKQRYSDATIVEVYCWAVLHDRPTVWASRPEHWPAGLRRGSLPSQSVLSRRLRTRGVERLFQRLEEAILRNGRIAPLVSIIDGKPLPVANHSHDRQAGYGRAVGGKAKGYKLHALLDAHGTVWGWRVAPMHKDERTMAHRLLRKLPSQGYLLADANYDSNKLFADAPAQGVQLIVPRRYGPGRGVGHRAQHPARLRSRDLLENTVSTFGLTLHNTRRAIERFFGSLTCSASGLSHLPAWVRTHRRVRRWVHAKLIINQLRADNNNPPVRRA